MLPLPLSGLPGEVELFFLMSFVFLRQVVAAFTRFVSSEFQQKENRGSERKVK
jgi:hypothetical protein